VAVEAAVAAKALKVDEARQQHDLHPAVLFKRRLLKNPTTAAATGNSATNLHTAAHQLDG
jgi:hypothetical protein